MVKEVEPYCPEFYFASPIIVWAVERTFHAIFRSATNLSQDNFSFERTEDDKTELD